MTKRQQAAQTGRQEEDAVRMYQAGATLKQIKAKTTVDAFIVKGLVVAVALGSMRIRGAK